MNLVIFTDLDGTLLDQDTYSYKKAMPALKEVKKRGIPLIICTSKTRAEIEIYMEKLRLKCPFISENGGAIFIPLNYFSNEIGKKFGGYIVIELGTNYRRLRKTLGEIKYKLDNGIIGFGDMNPEELSRDSGLDITEARLAKRREYDEAFRVKGTDDDLSEIFNLIEASGLHYTKGGRYYHLIGDNDKGKAVEILTDLYREKHPGIKTIALGDSQNDFPMLESVDIPVLIKRPGGYARFRKKGLIKSKLIGPSGWNEVILDLIVK